MLTKSLLTCLLFASAVTAITIVGCGEGNVKPAAMGVLFPTMSQTEEIPSADTDIKKILRVTDASQKIIGYKVEMQVVSRSGPFDIMIVLDSNACVLDAHVVKYRAMFGKKVRSKAFTRQFKGKCPGDAIQLGNDIDAITTATLSSKAMTKGVKKAINRINRIAQKNKD
jgi:Na+-translocating ferredoxin:NAD+ oxidoreductase RnfG subunit